MKNHTYSTQEEDYSHQSNRNAKSIAYDEQLIKESTNSIKSNDNRKLCKFRRDKDGYGFKITGNAPVKVQSVRKDSFAWNSGLRENDVIIEINDHSVIDKQHKDVVALIRKESEVKLFVESDLSSTLSLSPSLTKLPNHDPPQDRPNHLPKSAPMVLPKPKPRNVIPQPSNVNSAMYRPQKVQSYIEPPKVQIPIDDPQPATKSDSTDNTSECSISTSSNESEPPKKVPTKSTPSGFISPTESQNGTPTKSNSYNIPKSINISTMKSLPLQKKIPSVKVKNKTIPPDGSRSYNPSVSDINIKSKQQSSYGTLPDKRSSGFIHGRDFDDEAKDDDESDASLSLIDMLSSPKEALSKPGLVAILLIYVKEKFEDMKIMMFYYCCKFYKFIELRRDFQTDAQRMSNEIITMFLCEKSPLYINVNPELLNETLSNSKSVENSGELFNEILIRIYDILTDIVQDVRGKVKRGIQLSEDISSMVNTMNSDTYDERHMNLLHRTMCNIFNRFPKDSDLDMLTMATKIGLATMYQYFHESNALPGISVRARSTDCLTNLSNQSRPQSIGNFFKVPTLCALYQQNISRNKRKKSKTVNGHDFVDAACTEPEECAMCKGLLWGASPQGSFCTMCKDYYHVICKTKNKIPCSRKLRKSNSQLNNKEEKIAFFGRLSRKSSTNSVRSVNMSMSGDNVGNVGGNFFNNCAIGAEEKTSSMMMEENLEMTKSYSEDQLNRVATGNSFLDRYGSSYDFTNQCTDNGIVDQNTVQIQELVQDEALNDPDMRMEESFDAENEINSVFPDVDEECNKKRLIVLLEFYHKTRYILMNLKRFWYSLVQKWPQTQLFYFKALSLDCIVPFVNLINSLVQTIEKCIVDKKNFVGLEQAVLDWLSDNNDDRLKEWISLSSNLCCTNSLNIIKQMKQTTLRTIPELATIMKAKFHKLVMIEELTQIRPLLISLPLIVKNIIKCLNKQEPLFTEELAVWKQVSIKMDYLCEYIDRCCIPLVDWINNGSIVRRSEKFEWQNKSSDVEKDIRDLFAEFPRTLFHFPIFDFQIAKIIVWSTNTKKIGLVIPTSYFKKGTEVLLIFYKNFIVVLQKENDHYCLKPIRPLKNLFDKVPPIIEIDESTHVTNGGQEDNNFVLNMVNNKPDNAFLLRIGFSRLEVVESWLDYISTKTYNLGRSIALFKSSDLRCMPETSSHFERSVSNVSGKSKVSQESLDSSVIPSINPDNDDKSVTNYMALSETLTKVSDILNSSSSLSAILDVPEENMSNHIKLIRDEGAKSDDDMLAMLYTLSQTAIQQTHHFLAKSCQKVPLSSDSDLDQFIGILNTTSIMLEKLKRASDNVDDVTPPVVVQIRPKKSPEMNTQYDQPDIKLRCPPKSAGNVTNISDENSSQDENLHNDITTIIDEIIEHSVERVRNSQELRDSRSYKYVPTESLVPSLLADDCFLSETALTPTYGHLNTPDEEVVTVSRAQIVLQNRKSSHQSNSC